MPRAYSNSLNALARFLVWAALFACLAGPALLCAQNTPAAPAPQPDSPTASELYNQGLAAEQASNWEIAFVAYSGALAKSPEDRAIRVRMEIARFQVAQQRTERAQREFLAGRRDTAIATLRSALQIDPGYSAARDLLEQLQQQRTFAGDLAPLPTASGPPRVTPEPGLRNFDYRGPIRGAFGEIARQFGLVASFDTDLADRDVRLRIAAVDFQTTMDVMEQLTGTFWISTDSRTFFVTADTADKRSQYDPEITVSIPLPAADSTDDMTETTRVVRDITGIRRSTLDADSHTLTLRDTPDNVELARQLIQDIDQPRGEVLLDIDLLEVNRDAAQRIGISPPSGARAFTLSTGQIRQLQDAQNNGTLLQVLQTIFGAQNPLATGTNLSALIPPLIVFGGGNSTFLATLPGIAADFSRTLSVVRQAQRVLLRVKDGEPGQLFVGEKFPITLALLSQSLVSGQSQFSPGLSSGSFPRSDFAAGISPGAVATGDFNDDGNVDLAVANQAANTVSILLGDGKGGFAAHTDFATAGGPVALANIDFDRDGKLDLAVACDSGAVVSLLRGLGDGTFESAVNIPAGNNPAAILSRDLDQDGNPDLIVANRADNTVSIYLGNGDGTFDTRQNFAAANGPVALAAGDFDNDGKLDVAVANQSADNVSVFKGAGDGTFSTRTDFGAGSGPAGIDAADFNGDGRLDLVVANQTDNTVSVFTGDGNGSFSTRTNLNTGGAPTAVLAGDFNADEAPDIVAANQQDNTVSIFLSLNNGSFTPQLTLPVGNAPVGLAAADLNKDDRPDLIAANRASNNVTITLNTTTVPVSPNAPLTTYPASEYVDLGLKVRATPRIHPGNEVTLRLQFDISALTGRDGNGIPIIGNRSIDQMVRLRQGETSVLAGMIQSNELRNITGANPLGLLSGTLANRNTTDSDTELLIAITPREIRLATRAGRTLYAGRGEGPTAPPLPAPAGAPGQPPPGQNPNPPLPPAPGNQPLPGQLPPPPNGLPPQALPPDSAAPAPNPGQLTPEIDPR